MATCFEYVAPHAARQSAVSWNQLVEYEMQVNAPSTLDELRNIVHYALYIYIFVCYASNILFLLYIICITHFLCI